MCITLHSFIRVQIKIPDDKDNDLDDLHKRSAQHARLLIHQDLEEHFSRVPVKNIKIGNTSRNKQD